MQLYNYQCEELLASANDAADKQIKDLPLKETFQETLAVPFNSLPLPVKYLNSILLSSTVIHLATLGDYLCKAVFRHSPLPDLLPEELDKLVAFNNRLHSLLKEKFTDEYKLFTQGIFSVNAKADWFNKSNPYWITQH